MCFFFITLGLLKGFFCYTYQLRWVGLVLGFGLVGPLFRLWDSRSGFHTPSYDVVYEDEFVYIEVRLYGDGKDE